MANVLRYDPYGARLDSLVRNLLWPHVAVARNSERGVPIRVDVTETEQAYVVAAELPGVPRDQITVSIEANEVAISAEVKPREAGAGERVLCAERAEGKLYRAFTLGQDVDQEKATARYADGVLELTMPKKSVNGARKLEIH
jgi:HSP20 family protein